MREMQIKTTRYHNTSLEQPKPGTWKGWWGCKLEQSLWKTVWQFLTKLNTLLPYYPAIMFLGIYPRELKTHIHTKPAHEYHSSFIHSCQKLDKTKISLLVSG